MTEREAWLFLAKIWSAPTIFGNGHAVVYVGENNHGSSGLCSCINVLLPDTTRGDFIAGRMLMKLPKGAGDDYCWPRTAEGAKSRAAFCRKQAKLLAKKPKRKKVRA